MSNKSALHGKAFEYAVLAGLQKNTLNAGTNIEVQDNSALQTAMNAYTSIAENIRNEIDQAAIAGVAMLVEREPRIQDGNLGSSKLLLMLQSDQKGGTGDVRDIVLARPDENWEIGISAKHNHKAVKSSRLARELDFGKSWLQHPCSDAYKTKVRLVFASFQHLVGRICWRDLSDHGIEKRQIYIDVLEAFRAELLDIYQQSGSAVPSSLIKYLVGNHDFYKMMKIKDRTQLQAFNFDSSLGLKSRQRKASPEPQVLRLPKTIYDVHFSNDNPDNTIIVACDQGWQLSFRIHNASEFVEPSLKFDITLVGHPAELATQEVCWKN